MKKLSIFLAIALVIAMTVVPACAADEEINIALKTASSNIQPGTQFTVDVTFTPASKLMNALDFNIYWDATKVKYVSITPAVGSYMDNEVSGGRFFTLWGTNTIVYTEGKVATITFETLSDVSGATDITIDAEYAAFIPSIGSVTVEDIEEFASETGVTVKIGSEPVVEEKFEISATTDGGNVVVTAENIDKAVGEEIKVYVATYAGGVLVNCQEQALVEGPMTFTGLADASARVFVWDKYNVPVADVTIQ